MTEKSIGQREILFERGSKIRKTEKRSDLSFKETSHEELLAENARTKSSMAKELSQMGFSEESIERLLHLKMNMEETSLELNERQKQEKVRKHQKGG